jgi:hypothetical protein
MRREAEEEYLVSAIWLGRTDHARGRPSMHFRYSPKS